VIEAFLKDDGLIVAALEFAVHPERRHIMAPSRGGLLVSLFSLLSHGIKNVLQYNDSHPDFPLHSDVVARFTDKWVITSLLWGLGGSMDLQGRKELCAFLASKHHVSLPAGGGGAGSELSALDCFADVQTGQWRLWQELVPATDVPSHAVLQTDAVVPTLDTVRHVVGVSCELSATPRVDVPD
jgi:dynein heavy chain 1